jgi:hypothetical protein
VIEAGPKIEGRVRRPIDRHASVRVPVNSARVRAVFEPTVLDKLGRGRCRRNEGESYSGRCRKVEEECFMTVPF